MTSGTAAWTTGDKCRSVTELVSVDGDDDGGRAGAVQQPRHLHEGRRIDVVAERQRPVSGWGDGAAVDASRMTALTRIDEDHEPCAADRLRQLRRELMLGKHDDIPSKHDLRRGRS